MILFLLALVVIGFVLFLFNRFVPMDAKIKSLINYLVVFVLIIAVIFFVLDLFGLYSAPAGIKFWK